MAAAALQSFYEQTKTLIQPSPLTLHDLSKPDIVSLVALLRNWPIDPGSAKHYWTDIQRLTSKLPSHLRNTSPLHLKPTHSLICAGHAGLNPSLIISIWSTLRGEMESSIGPFLYPIIVGAGLPAHQEYQARQLEPVLRMWQPDYDPADHVPAGRTPLPTGKEGLWAFQYNKCPACMLARLGSEKDELAALLSGMVGRLRSGVVGRRDDVRSRRVRWVLAALKLCRGGVKAADEAWVFGLELKRVRRAWKEHRKGVAVKGGFYGNQKVWTVPIAYAGTEGSEGRETPSDVSRSFHSEASYDIELIDFCQKFVPEIHTRRESDIPSFTGFTKEGVRELHSPDGSYASSEEARVNDYEDEFEWEVGSHSSTFSNTSRNAGANGGQPSNTACRSMYGGYPGYNTRRS
ncbi:hypothetical protein BU24DRAFT_49129 [Aaosphaeria arxii CBS 175.79]|uniref:Uncharacterized protein n=1 Tax=Aaosphaeria arxii CBS 175.79 TaxID=1450172 RepID=A0A6A5XD57_9PLEO|nr:uncharacterized protein BU24DRAFT_49129 [Aaosphaeria arxii CBS 175.79]KAF2010932.1 hypothetical protein BU24DRAFT_49129 [Aaosphaeria arxii CBS 175.79]